MATMMDMINKPRGKTGETVGLVECDVVDVQDRLVARASSTCMTLRDAKASVADVARVRSILGALPAARRPS